MKLTVENASFSYKKGTPVLQNINFSVASGQLVAILGPNGAGKTTLLRCLMGFLPWDSGISTIDGENIRTMPARKLWQRISYVPQARGSFASLTAREMILLGCTNHIGVFSSPGEEEIASAQQLAHKLGIAALLDKKCTQISGGELQMVLIARALAAKPQLLILDEPESNLDFKNQLIVLDTMSQLAADGICCLFNTHYPTHALMRATKSLILEKGGNTIFGDTPDIVTEDNIRRAFGVEAVIGQVETSDHIYQSILPLRIATQESEARPVENAKGIAVVSAIFSDFSLGTKINEVLHEYGSCIVGRMGMPYEQGGVYIINVTLDAPQNAINALSHKLSILPGLHVKTTFVQAKENENESL